MEKSVEKRRGFTKVDNVIFGAGLTGTELAVWVVIKSHEYGRRPYPLPYQKIADEGGMCRLTAIRVVKNLIAKGAIQVVVKNDRGAQAYRCLLPTHRSDSMTPRVTSHDSPGNVIPVPRGQIK